MFYEYEYIDLVHTVINEGEEISDRTGVGTYSMFGGHMHINLQSGFPAITTKELKFKSVVSELLWFLEGSPDERRLAEIHYGKPREELIGKRTIWTDNADNQGKALGYRNNDLEKYCGPIYGHQWRYGSELSQVDQIANVIEGIKKDPHSRRHVVNSWNPHDLPRMALPPCHMSFQFHVSKSGLLSCHMYQRSADLGLGVPFNIASYALLTYMIAQVCDLKPGKLIMSFGDMHVYKDHAEPLKELFVREPYDMPKLWLNPNVKNIDDFKMEDIKLLDYNFHPHIPLKMAV